VTPDYVNVVVVGADRRYLFFRQGKYALDRESLAPVGGYMEPGESALAAAQRELREEAGLRCREWHELGRFVVDANRGCGSGHFFLARAPEAVPRVESDDLEVQVPVWLTREEIETAIDAGDMGLMPWVSVVLLALRFEDRQG
jgi:ADP-ribose pyrophosphatase